MNRGRTLIRGDRDVGKNALMEMKQKADNTDGQDPSKRTETVDRQEAERERLIVVLNQALERDLEELFDRDKAA
jgi:hypothetical protein